MTSTTTTSSLGALVPSLDGWQDVNRPAPPVSGKRSASVPPANEKFGIIVSA